MNPPETRKCPICSQFFSVYHILIHKIKCRKKSKMQSSGDKMNQNSSIKIDKNKMPLPKKIPKKKIRKRKNEEKSARTENKNQNRRQKRKKKLANLFLGKETRPTGQTKKIPKKKRENSKLDKLMSEPRSRRKRCPKCSSMVSIANMRTFHQHTANCPYSECEYCHQYFPNQILVLHKRYPHP